MLGLRWVIGSLFSRTLIVTYPYLRRKDAFIIEDLHYASELRDNKRNFYGVITNPTSRQACWRSMLELVAEVQRRRLDSGWPPYKVHIEYTLDENENTRYGWEDPDIGGGRPYTNQQEKDVYEAEAKRRQEAGYPCRTIKALVKAELQAAMTPEEKRRSAAGHPLKPRGPRVESEW